MLNILVMLYCRDLPAGVSIAIMGCIVNGPGEMADADFGYVGGAPGKIDLYVGKEVVRRAIPMSGATDELIELIKVTLLCHLHYGLILFNILCQCTQSETFW